jgi:thiol:disulfide interchange protein DsbD
MWVVSMVLLAGAGPAEGQLGGDPLGPMGLPGLDASEPGELEVSVVPSLTRVTPGSRLHLAVILDVADDWALYSPHPESTDDFPVKPLVLSADTGPLPAEPTLWPMDEPYVTDLGATQAVNNAYKGRAIAYVPVMIPGTVEPGSRTLSVLVSGQVCGGPDNLCIPVDVSAETEITVAPEAVAHPQWTNELAAGLDEAMPLEQLVLRHAAAAEGGSVAVGSPAPSFTLWGGLAVAFLVGLTFNIMPCVLPIIPIRIFSIVSLAGESRRKYVSMGLAFAAGILAFFLALAVVSTVLRVATGEALNVSDHFQYAGVRIALALLMVALAAFMFGAFDVAVPGKLASAEAGGKSRFAHVKSAGMGLMMAILATPCSFGLLLVSLAWAQVQPPWVGAAVFAVMGLGMAAPHAALVAFPQLVEKLPKPGRWMELFKQAMGFPLVGVAVWLFSTLTDDSGPFWAMGFGVVLAMGLWVWAQWVRYDAPLARKLVIRGSTVVLVVLAGWWMLSPPPEGTQFESFDLAAIREARAAGRPVLVKFTASWCGECQLIDYRVYRTTDVARQLERRGVLAVKGDVTDRDAPASDYLKDRFNAAPPLTVIYPPNGGPPIRLTGSFDAEDLFHALDRAEDKL